MITTFFGILYILIWFISTTLAFMQFIDDGKKRWRCGLDGSDYGFYAFAAFFIGAVWPVVIWFALIVWKTSGETPYWVTVIQDIHGIFKK